MFELLVRFSMKFRVLVTFVAVLTLAGVVAADRSPLDLLPEFSPPTVEIQTEAIGLAAIEVEALITVPLEEFLAGVPWLRSQRSVSINGLSSINLEFLPGTDALRARQMVQERLLNVAALPNVSKPPTMRQPVSSSNRVMSVSLVPDGISMIDTSVLARWKVKPRLMGVPGVANVAIWGERNRQLQVQVDPQKLQAAGATLLDVIRATGDGLWVSPLTFLNASTPGAGGFIETPNQRLDIRHVLPISSPADLAKIVFRKADKSLVRLGDVATVVEGHQPLTGDAMINGKPGLMLVVEKFPWANTIEVTKGVEKVLRLMQPGLTGIAVDTSVFRAASFVEYTATSLRLALLVVCISTAVALAAFGLGLRAALISSLSVGASLALVLAALRFLGVQINILSLAGFSAAMPIVFTETIFGVQKAQAAVRNALEAGKKATTDSVICAAFIETCGQVVSILVITLAFTAPALMLESTLGLFVRPLIAAFCFTVLASAVVTFTLTPALCSIFLASPRRAPTRLLHMLHKQYLVVLNQMMRKPRGVFVAAFALAVLGFAALAISIPRLLPSFTEPTLLLTWQGAIGQSLPDTNAQVGKASARMLAIPGVRNVSVNIGRAASSDKVVDVNSAEFWVSIEPGADYNNTVSRVKDAAAAFSEFEPGSGSSYEQQMNRWIKSSDRALSIRIYGPDPTVLRSKAAEIETALTGVSGLRETTVAAELSSPQIEIEVNLVNAEKFGLKPGDVRRSVSTLLSGIEVGNLFEDQKVFEAIVWGVPAIRTSIESIKGLLLDAPGGQYVRLSEIAEVRLTSGPSVFVREGASRYLDIKTAFDERDFDDVRAEIEERISAMQFPREYHAEVGGESEPEDGVLERLVLRVAIAMIAAFLVLQAYFGNWWFAAVGLGAVLLELLGGAIAGFLGGGQVSIGWLAGLLVVIALACRGVIIVLGQSRKKAVDASHIRPETFPIASEQLLYRLLVAVAIALACVTIIAMGSRPGLEIIRPMAQVVLGGIIAASFVELFLLPILLAHFSSFFTANELTSGELALKEPQRSTPLANK